MHTKRACPEESHRSNISLPFANQQKPKANSLSFHLSARSPHLLTNRPSAQAGSLGSLSCSALSFGPPFSPMSSPACCFFLYDIAQIRPSSQWLWQNPKARLLMTATDSFPALFPFSHLCRVRTLLAKVIISCPQTKMSSSHIDNPSAHLELSAAGSCCAGHDQTKSKLYLPCPNTHCLFSSLKQALCSATLPTQ